MTPLILCVICRDNYQVERIRFLSCGHGFCKVCTKGARSDPNCAVCRKPKGGVKPFTIYPTFADLDASVAGGSDPESDDEEAGLFTNQGFVFGSHPTAEPSFSFGARSTQSSSNRASSYPTRGDPRISRSPPFMPGSHEGEGATALQTFVSLLAQPLPMEEILRRMQAVESVREGDEDAGGEEPYLLGRLPTHNARLEILRRMYEDEDEDEEGYDTPVLHEEDDELSFMDRAEGFAEQMEEEEDVEEDAGDGFEAQSEDDAAVDEDDEEDGLDDGDGEAAMENWMDSATHAAADPVARDLWSGVFGQPAAGSSVHEDVYMTEDEGEEDIDARPYPLREEDENDQTYPHQEDGEDEDDEVMGYDDVGGDERDEDDTDTTEVQYLHYQGRPSASNGLGLVVDFEPHDEEDEDEDEDEAMEYGGPSGSLHHHFLDSADDEDEDAMHAYNDEDAASPDSGYESPRLRFHDQGSVSGYDGSAESFDEDEDVEIYGNEGADDDDDEEPLGPSYERWLHSHISPSRNRSSQNRQCSSGGGSNLWGHSYSSSDRESSPMPRYSAYGRYHPSVAEQESDGEDGEEQVAYWGYA